MASPVRRLEIGLVICGLLAGFGATLAGITAVRDKHHSAVRSAASAAPTATVVGPGEAGQSSPAALDSEWAAYSREATCADWAGGDGVSAIRLNSSQLAWFFSDSYLGPAGPATGFSQLSGFVHNLVVMQTTVGTPDAAGMGGKGSRFVTLTGGGACARPGQSSAGALPAVSTSPSPAVRRHQRYWDEDGLTAGGYVVKFYNSYLPGFQPFIPVGTEIARFPVAQLAAAGHGPPFGGTARPLLTALPAYTPAVGGTPIVWGSAVLRAGGTVYVYGWQSSDPRVDTRQLYLARVPAGRITDFTAWRFYTGGGQWQAGQQNAQPVGADFSVSTGFSVVPMGGRYWLIQQAVQAGSPDIDAFPADTPWGPFDPSGGILLYRSPDIGLDQAHDYRIMYEARAEPALSTAKNLIISYNVNSEAVTTGCVPMSAYTNTITQPRFISVPRAAFSGMAQPGSLNRYRVISGPSPYPSITSKDPGQWFNGWSYRGGCPPVPAVPNVAARQGGGALWLEWPDVGLGLRYRVYVRKAGDQQYALARTVFSPGASLTGLGHGQTYQMLVVAVNLKQHTGQGTAVTVTVR
jgi:hypothetical protein